MTEPCDAAMAKAREVAKNEQYMRCLCAGVSGLAGNPNYPRGAYYDIVSDAHMLAQQMMQAYQP